MSLYARYQIGLRAGYYRWATSTRETPGNEEIGNWKINSDLINLSLPEKIRSTWGGNLPKLLSLADEITAGQVHLFGGPAIPLNLSPTKPLKHWIDYERQQAEFMSTDIKWMWEAARFGWAITLAQAYHVTKEERYSHAFWQFIESFLASNPPYLGPNWVSAQEVAIRLIALVFSIQIFIESPQTTSDRLNQLSLAIAVHARRIPPTLSYARAQNNNHLLSEAAGLITASLALPGHPQAAHWGNLGQHWFFQAIRSQIAMDGAYIQQSANYHRLMLQIALWVYTLGVPLPEGVKQDLAIATQWLLKLVDPWSGEVPNLGPNDSAYILPLSACSYSDFRPTLQAASLAFLDRTTFKGGVWDDMALWLSQPRSCQATHSPVLTNMYKIPSPLPPDPCAHSPHILTSPGHSSWAYLRAAHFTNRPGHADQLHFDLWWRGINLAMDAGTYSYNNPAPWDNAFTSSHVHNTITINNADQMTRAGRFLWLDWAQAEIKSCKLDASASVNQIVAQHNGYRRLGLLHQRKVIAEQGGHWCILDHLASINQIRDRKQAYLPKQFSARLHWLLPDWPWSIQSDSGNTHLRFQLESPYGLIKLHLEVDPENLASKPVLQVVRAGEILYGTGSIHPTWGWNSSTYQTRFPALSIGYRIEAHPPVTIKTEWILPDEE